MKGLSTILEEDELVFSHSKQLVEEYHLRAKKGFAWATITISQDGSFNAQSDYGSFSYSWPRHGRDSFKSFLIEITRSCAEVPHGYFYDKIKDLSREGRVDVETTVKNIKNLVIKARRDAGLNPFTEGRLRECTHEEARELWDDLNNMQSWMDSIVSGDLLYSTLSNMDSLKGHIIDWDTIVNNYDEIIEYTYDTQALAFCKYILPALCNILREELKEADGNKQSSAGSTESSAISSEQAGGT